MDTGISKIIPWWRENTVHELMQSGSTVDSTKLTGGYNKDLAHSRPICGLYLPVLGQ